MTGTEIETAIAHLANAIADTIRPLVARDVIEQLGRREGGQPLALADDGWMKISEIKAEWGYTREEVMAWERAREVRSRRNGKGQNATYRFLRSDILRKHAEIKRSLAEEGVVIRTLPRGATASKKKKKGGGKT